MTKDHYAYRLSVAAILAVMASPAYAQEQDDSVPAAEQYGQTGADEDPEEIVVTAARTELPPSALPLTIDIIDKEALDQQVSIAGSVIDAVSNLAPSFSPTRQKLSGAGETLRGRSPLYAINGIPQSTPIRDGSRDGYTIDPFFLERVELIYGSNALQGIGATGGVVNQIVIAPPKQDGLSGRVLLQGAANDGFDSNGFGAKVGGVVMVRSGAFDVTGGAAWERRGMYYDGHGQMIGIDAAQGDAMNSESLSFFGRLGFALSDTARIEIFGNRFSLEGSNDYTIVPGSRALGVPSTSIRAPRPGEVPSNRVETVNLTLKDSDLFGGNLIFQAFYNRSRDIFGGDISATFQDASIAPVDTLFDQSANRSRKIGARASYEFTIADALTTTLGFDSMWDKTEQSLIHTGRYWVPPTTFRTLAPFGQANLKLFDGVLRLAGGARWENGQLKVDDFVTLASYNSARVTGGTRSFEDVLINGGIIVEPARGIRAYASYAEGYSIADIGRILRSVNGATQPNFTLDDVNVSPVISNNREIGVELKRGPLTASATYFWSSSKDGSLLVLNSAGVYDVLRQRIEIEGIEINLAVDTPIDGLRVGTGYAHLAGNTDTDRDGVVDADLDGANISPDRLNLWAQYQKGSLSGRIQSGFYLSRRFDGLPQANAFEGYNLTDAVIQYDTGKLGALSFSVSNLFDKFYVTYNSDTVSVTDNSRFFAGRGRVMTLGWNYRF